MNVGGGTTRLILGIIIGLVVGLLVGAWLFSYGPLAIEWTDAHSYDLAPAERAVYVSLVADSYQLTHDPDIRSKYLNAWEEAEIRQAIDDAILRFEQEGRAQKVQALRDLEMVLGLAPGAATPTTPGATATVTAAPPRTTGIVDRLRVPCLIFFFVLLVLVLASIGVRVALNRRSAAQGAPAARRAPVTRPVEVPPPEEWTGVGQPPLGHFITTYKLGEDTYDESFSIETPAGEFLGECGVGISETIGKGEPDQVTAFEVWLFDKSDIRTVTKVLMSDFAYHDDGVRTKLQPKGEAVLARPGVPFFLETSGLQVQATVNELVYGEGQTPPKSFFQKLTVELVATAKPPAA